MVEVLFVCRLSHASAVPDDAAKLDVNCAGTAGNQAVLRDDRRTSIGTLANSARRRNLGHYDPGPTGLAFHDRATTGKLHPRTRKELDRIWTIQRDDGSLEWPFRDTPPFKCDEHHGATIAALGASVAPDNYAQSEKARIGLTKVRRYLKAATVTSLH